MRRFASRVFAAFFISFLFASLSGCGSSNPVGTSTTPTPTKVLLIPTTGTLDLGATLAFSASLIPPAAVPVVFTSSNPRVLSFVPSAGGLACAGRWDTLGRVCTPGGAGVTQVTASANGVTSAPVLVYVHEHVDLITLDLINPPIPQPDCITLAKGPGIQNYLDFQARAFRVTGGTQVEITNTVGNFTFSQTNSSVATLNTSDPALNNNNGKQVTQARFTAAVPGLTQIFASVAGVSSQPAQIPDKNGALHPYFETCLVQSLNLQVSDAATNTSFSVANNTSGVILTPTVIDRLGNNLQNPIPQLTFITSSAANATVAGGTSKTTGTASVSTKAAGGVSITAECFAPTCNVGLQPVQPVYSSTTPSVGNYVGNPIIGLITGAPATTGTVYVTTTQCESAAGGPISGCQPLLFPIDIKSNAAGVSTTLPSSPNSLIFSPVASSTTGSAGFKAYLGSSAGLIIFTPGTATTGGAVVQLNDVPGKVLAVSLDGDKAIVSDTTSVPNQVYIVSGFVAGSSRASVPLLLSGVKAAAFSPDGLRAFLVTDNTMYVYSPSLALKTVGVPAGETAVSSYVNGSLTYLAGSNGVTLRNACDTTYAQAAAFSGGHPAIFRALADGERALGVASPGLDIFTAQVKAPDPATLTNPSRTTCPYTVQSTDFNFVNLGQGTFTPLKLLVAPDNSRAYILASNLGSVFVVDLGVNAVSSIPLTGNPVPLDASLTPDGSLIYVGADDGSVHVLSTISGGDLQQITFSGNNSSNETSLCSNIPQTCNPDLVAVQP
ncbi:MAG TPA: WD40 repeat domain-containing protein [Terriglobales bacterium]|nr:WD40 repeat domain-containing protein [Terriglobales bacterium]